MISSSFVANQLAIIGEHVKLLVQFYTYCYRHFYLIIEEEHVFFVNFISFKRLMSLKPCSSPKYFKNNHQLILNNHIRIVNQNKSFSTTKLLKFYHPINIITRKILTITRNNWKTIKNNKIHWQPFDTRNFLCGNMNSKWNLLK